MKKVSRIFTMIFSLCIMIVLTACGNSYVPVSSISFSVKDVIEIVVGQEYSPTLTFTPSYSSDRDYKLTSADTSIMTVVGTNIVGVATGNTYLTATSNDGSKTDTIAVKVYTTSIQLAIPTISDDQIELLKTTGVFYYSAVDNVDYYEISINDKVVNNGDKTYYSNFEIGKLNTLKVRAVGDELVKLSSDYSKSIEFYILPQVDDIQISDSVISWTHISDINKYDLKITDISGTSQTIDVIAADNDETYYNLLDSLTAFSSLGEYTITILPDVDSAELDEDVLVCYVVQDSTINTLYADSVKNIKINADKITFTSDYSDVQYKIMITSAENTYTYYTYETSFSLVENNDIVTGNYTLKIEIIPNGSTVLLTNNDNVANNTITIQKLDTPEISIESGNIVISNITDASGYYLYINGTILDIGKVNSYSLGATYLSGEYELQVRSYGAENILRSNISSVTTVFKTSASSLIVNNKTLNITTTETNVTHYIYINDEYVTSITSNEYDLSSIIVDTQEYSIFIKTLADGKLISNVSNTVSASIIEQATGIYVSNGYIYVTGTANSYQIGMFDTEGLFIESVIIDTDFLYIEDYIENSTITFKVRALGDNINYFDSLDYSEESVDVSRMATPVIIAENNSVSWEIGYYTIYVNDVLKGSYENTFEMSEFVAGTYILNASADGNDAEILDSYVSEDLTIIILDVVTNLDFEEYNFSFYAIDEAINYDVFLNDELVSNIDTANYLFSSTDFEDAGSYTINVVSKGNGYEVFDSGTSELIEIVRLPQIESFMIDTESDILSWEEIDGSTYAVSLNDSTSSIINVNYISLTNITDNTIVTVKAIGTTNYILDGASSSIEIDRLTTTEISFNDGVLSWNHITNAVGYNISIKYGEDLQTLYFEIESLDSNNETLSTDTLPDYMTEAGIYYIAVQPIGDENFLNGYYGNEITVEKLEATVVSSYSEVENNYNYVYLQWTAVDNAEYYVIDIASNSSFSNIIKSEIVTENIYDINTSDIPSGNIYVRVYVYAIDGAYLDSNVSNTHQLQKFNSESIVLTITDGTNLSLNKISSATHYTLKFDTQDWSDSKIINWNNITSTNYDITSLLEFSTLEAGTYNLEVVAGMLTNGTQSLTSETISFEIIILGSTTLIYSNGVVSWEKVDNALSYEVILTHVESQESTTYNYTNELSETNTISVTDLIDEITISGEYTITVQAIGGDNASLNGLISDSITINKLESITISTQVLEVTDYTNEIQVVWNDAEIVYEYLVEISDTETFDNYIVESFTTVATLINITDILSQNSFEYGYVFVRVSVIATIDTIYISAEPSNVLNYEKLDNNLIMIDVVDGEININQMFGSDRYLIKYYTEENWDNALIIDWGIDQTVEIFNTDDLEAGSYTLQIIAVSISESGYYINSSIFEYTFGKTESVELSVVDGVVQFTTFYTGEIDYEVFIDGVIVEDYEYYYNGTEGDTVSVSISIASDITRYVTIRTLISEYDIGRTYDYVYSNISNSLEVIKLSSVDNIVITNGIINWEFNGEYSTENQSYFVEFFYINHTEQKEVSDTTIIIPDTLIGGSYTVYINPIGDSTIYLSGSRREYDPLIVLEAPLDVASTNGYISWTGDVYATAYQVVIYPGETLEFTDAILEDCTVVDVGNVTRYLPDSSVLTEGVYIYTVAIIAIGNGSTIINSTYSTLRAFVKLAEVSSSSFIIVGGNITFGANSLYESVEIIMVRNESYVDPGTEIIDEDEADADDSDDAGDSSTEIAATTYTFTISIRDLYYTGDLLDFSNAGDVDLFGYLVAFAYNEFLDISFGNYTVYMKLIGNTEGRDVNFTQDVYSTLTSEQTIFLYNYTSTTVMDAPIVSIDSGIINWENDETYNWQYGELEEQIGQKYYVTLSLNGTIVFEYYTFDTYIDFNEELYLEDFAIGLVYNIPYSTGAYSVQVRAVGDDSKYLTSKQSNIKTVIILESTSTLLVDGNITWSTNSNAEGYLITLLDSEGTITYVYANDNTIDTLDISGITSLDTGLYVLPENNYDNRYDIYYHDTFISGTYVVNIVAIGNGNDTLTSPSSIASTYTKIDINNVGYSLYNGRLIWKYDSSATSINKYYVVINDKTTIITLRDDDGSLTYENYTIEYVNNVGYVMFELGEEYTTGVIYNVSIKAIGNSNYITSNLSEEISAEKYSYTGEVFVEDGYLQWTGSAEKYELIITMLSLPDQPVIVISNLSSKFYNLTDTVDYYGTIYQLNGGDYTVKIKAMNTGMFISDASDICEFTRISDVSSLTIENGCLIFDAVDYATSYTINYSTAASITVEILDEMSYRIIYSSTNIVYVNSEATISSFVIDLTDSSYLAGSNITVSIIGMADDYYTSRTVSKTISKLYAPTNLQVSSEDNNYITWDEVANADAYQISIVSNDVEVYTETVDTNAFEWSNITLASGSYILYVKALSTNSNYINSNYSTGLQVSEPIAITEVLFDKEMNMWYWDYEYATDTVIYKYMIAYTIVDGDGASQYIEVVTTNQYFKPQLLGTYQRFAVYVVATVLSDFTLYQGGDIVFDMFDDGDGTSTNPYVINTFEQFLNINYYLDADYILGDSIDLSDAGNYTEIISGEFTGSLDGNGYSISGLNISNTLSITGIFKQTYGATITNIILSDISLDVTINTSSEIYIGLLVGYAINTDISNITINNASLNVYIFNGQTTTISIGGLVGMVIGYMPSVDIYNSEITNINIIGLVTDITSNTSSNSVRLGGLAGSIGNSATTGYILIDNVNIDVSDTNSGSPIGLNFGGLSAYNYGTISNSNVYLVYNNSTMVQRIAGIVVFNNGIIQDVITDGSIYVSSDSANDRFAGIVVVNYSSGTITGAINSIDITIYELGVASRASGIVIENEGVISDLTNVGTITSQNASGSLIITQVIQINNNSSNVTDCNYWGDVDAYLTSANINSNEFTALANPSTYINEVTLAMSFRN